MKKNEGKRHTVAVIGGGAAGMMAAIEAARQGAIVTIIEKNTQLGKKLAATGNGRCNYTNLDMTACIGGKYHGMHADFAEPALHALPPKAVIHWFQEIGVEPRFRGTYVYPNSDQASAVVEAMQEELLCLSVKIHYGETVKSIERMEEDKTRYFLVNCKDAIVKAERVILAAGSKAAPKTGASGDGYFLARKLGHSLVPYVPALCGIRCVGDFFPTLAGIRVEARLRLSVDGQVLCEEEGELQLTEYGLSGIPVFQLSRDAAYALRDGRKTSVYINFLPGWTEDETAWSSILEDTVMRSPSGSEKDRGGRLLSSPSTIESQREKVTALYRVRRQKLSSRTMEHFFTGLLHPKLARLLLRMANVSRDLPVSELREKQLSSLAALSVSFKANCAEMNGFQQAQVVAGGVNTEEVNPETMESRLVPGLFLAGELLDIDGICGGYNLQWAWVSGYVAGRHAAE